MGLKKLELSSFRALSQKFFSFADSNLISGKNGSGKTTLLESIYFSIENKSFKTNNMNSFYPFEDDFFALKALFDFFVTLVVVYIDDLNWSDAY